MPQDCSSNLSHFSTAFPKLTSAKCSFKCFVTIRFFSSFWSVFWSVSESVRSNNINTSKIITWASSFLLMVSYINRLSTDQTQIKYMHLSIRECSLNCHCYALVWYCMVYILYSLYRFFILIRLHPSVIDKPGHGSLILQSAKLWRRF